MHREGRPGGRQASTPMPGRSQSAMSRRHRPQRGHEGPLVIRPDPTDAPTYMPQRITLLKAIARSLLDPDFWWTDVAVDVRRGCADDIRDVRDLLAKLLDQMEA